MDSSRLTQVRGQRRCARKSISRRRAVGAHSLGRSHRHRGFRRRGAARYGRASVALVQSLAEGFRRICERAAHSPFCLGRKSMAAGGRFPGRAELRALSAQRRAREFPQRRWRAFRGYARARTSPATYSFTIPEVPVLAPGGPCCTERAIRSGRAGTRQQRAGLYHRAARPSH